MALINLLTTNPNTRHMLNDPLEYMGTLILLIVGATIRHATRLVEAYWRSISAPMSTPSSKQTPQ